MKRDSILSESVPDAQQRRAQIESEPLPRNFAELIAEATRGGGDALVWHFIDSGEKLFYRDLEHRVHSVAAGLQAKGVSASTHVAVMLPNIAEMPLAWLALGVLGAVMVPLNPSYSEREVEYVLHDSEATYVITTAQYLPLIEKTLDRGKASVNKANIILVGDREAGYASFDDVTNADASAFRVPTDVQQTSLMNIQYTSGTTGFPKGCMLSQRFWLSSGKVNAFRDGRVYRTILASTPFYYMDPQWLLLMTLYQRATIFIAEKQSASRFHEWLRTYKIEFCLLPYITLKQPITESDALNFVKRANVYGVPHKMHEEIEARFDLVAREAFGMTEIGPTLYMPIEATDMVGSGSCGIPCPFRECKVVDEAGAELPDGTVGELAVRGEGIMLGYWKRPDATESAFMGDWFRTGDLFKKDDRGYFYLVGRVKDTIRRSGENIAAREVESVLASYPDVSEVAVVPVKDDTRGEEIKALIVWQDGIVADQARIESLIEYCRSNLAPFKVPRFYESRSSLPKTGSSKIAKHVLIAERPELGARVYDRSSFAKSAEAGLS